MAAGPRAAQPASTWLRILVLFTLASFLESMFPPETMQITRPGPARPETAAATGSAPAPSAITCARSARSRTAAAVSSSESANAPSTSSFAPSHIAGRSAFAPEPSTNDAR